jgi:hypothetical protein
MSFAARSLVVVVAVALGALANLAHAQETQPAAAPPPPAPTADEIKRVTAYYLKGAAAGPILLELTLCSEIGKNDEGKMACGPELPASIKKGDAITAFVKLFAPKGGKYEDLKVKFLLDGEVRTTADFTVTESWTGYGNYKKTTASKAGTWEVQVLRGEVVLASKKVSVS